MGCHALLQGIFPTQRSNPGLLHCRQTLYHLLLLLLLSRFSGVLLCATPWTVACRVPLSMEFFRQEYWRGLPFPSPGDLPDPGIGPRDRTQVPHIAGRFFIKTEEALSPCISIQPIFSVYPPGPLLKAEMQRNSTRLLPSRGKPHIHTHTHTHTHTPLTAGWSDLL